MSDDARQIVDPPRVNRKMVRVYNSHKFRSFHLGDGVKIGPGEQGRIPLPVWEKVKDRMAWLKRAERGDV